MDHADRSDISSWFLARVTGGSIGYLLRFGHATVVVQALLTGLALSQAWRFFANAKDDPRILKFALGIMTLICW